jgi:hypothetical protein
MVKFYAKDERFAKAFDDMQKQIAEKISKMSKEEFDQLKQVKFIPTDEPTPFDNNGGDEKKINRGTEGTKVPSSGRGR